MIARACTLPPHAQAKYSLSCRANVADDISSLIPGHHEVLPIANTTCFIVRQCVARVHHGLRYSARRYLCGRGGKLLDKSKTYRIPQGFHRSISIGRSRAFALCLVFPGLRNIIENSPGFYHHACRGRFFWLGCFSEWRLCLWNHRTYIKR